MPGLDKAYGRAQKYNRLGLASEIVSLDQNGLPMVDEAGNAILRLEYDEESGNLRGTKFFDVNGNITRVNDGYAETKMWDYDDNGNAGTQAYFGPDGKPALHKDGYHKFTSRYNERGNRIEGRFFGLDNQPILSKAGYHVWKARYDARGNKVEDRYFGLDDQPILSKGGYHLWKTSYDARGNPLESVFFDTEERPVADRDSAVHRISRVRDELGRIVEETYFGMDGKPTLHKKGYHKFTALYEERGNRIEERYFGLHDRPLLSKAGFHVSKASYDVRGNHIVWACFDTEERPMLSRDSGLHRISRVRDDLGRLVEEAYLILTTNRRSKKTSITN
jgi:hypothetical protein